MTTDYDPFHSSDMNVVVADWKANRERLGCTCRREPSIGEYGEDEYVLNHEHDCPAGPPFPCHEFDIDHPLHHCADCHRTHDCPDCGTLHTRWHHQEEHRLHIEEVWPDVLLLASRLEAVLGDADHFIGREAISVAEDNYRSKYGSDYYR